jgi:hypothetical protein
MGDGGYSSYTLGLGMTSLLDIEGNTRFVFTVDRFDILAQQLAWVSVQLM